MKSENQTNPVHPKFKDTFSEQAFPLPGVYCSVADARFTPFNVTETSELYHIALTWPTKVPAALQMTKRSLVVSGKQMAYTFYLPDDADTDRIALEQSGTGVTITIAKGNG